MITGELKYCNVQVKNPKEDKSDIDLRVQLKNKPKITVKLINNSPLINIKLNINTEIISASSGSSGFSSKEQTEKLEAITNAYFEEVLTNYLYKISKEYNTDIDGFGKYAVKYFSDKNSWDNYNWLNNFQNSFFRVEVKSNIKSSTNFING